MSFYLWKKLCVPFSTLIIPDWNRVHFQYTTIHSYSKHINIFQTPVDVNTTHVLLNLGVSEEADFDGTISLFLLPHHTSEHIPVSDRYKLLKAFLQDSSRSTVEREAIIQIFGLVSKDEHDGLEIWKSIRSKRTPSKFPFDTGPLSPVDTNSRKGCFHAARIQGEKR